MCLGKPFFPQGGRSEVPQAGCPGPPTPQEGRAGHFDQGEHKTNSAHQPAGEKSLLQRGGPHRVSLPAPSRSTPSSRPGGQHWWVAAAAGAPRASLPPSHFGGGDQLNSPARLAEHSPPPCNCLLFQEGAHKLLPHFSHSFQQLQCHCLGDRDAT